MPHQLTDFQRQVIILFKKENPTWGLVKCSTVLPEFFETITEHQFYGVCNKLRIEGSPTAKKRIRGSGRAVTIDSPTRRQVLTLAVSPQNSPRRGHRSQRQISRELGISKGSVSKIIKKSKLKCFRRVKCNVLTQQHKDARRLKSQTLIDRFRDNDLWKRVWFSDEASISLFSPLNRQNERIYREVTLKTEIPRNELLVEIDSQQPSIMCYGAVSWLGKTQLRFIEGFADGQEDLPAYRRKKKTVNQIVYTNEMCPLMFADIRGVMNDVVWTWQQDGARPHTARASVQWLRENAPQLILPDAWPSKSPDLNVMDFCIWGIILHNIQLHRRDIHSIDDLKRCLLDAWNAIPQNVIQRATASWITRLTQCHTNNGDHFEHL